MQDNVRDKNSKQKAKREKSKNTEGETQKGKRNMKFKKTLVFVLVSAIILLATVSSVAISNPELFRNMYAIFTEKIEGNAGEGELVARKMKGERNMMRELSDGLYAVINTAKGEILLNLFFDQTPMTVCNFVGLAEGKFAVCKGKPYYDGLKFHRVIDNFMIQGGCPLGTGTGGPGYAFPDEIVSSLKHEGAGVLSMANAGAGTNGSQFFITHVATPWLDGKHTVFGKVVKGQDVVNAIKQDDVINSISIIRKGKLAESFKSSEEDFKSYIAKVEEGAKKAMENALEDAMPTIKQKWPKAIKDDDGVLFFVSKEGKGVLPQKGQTLRMKYKGSLLDGKVFDDSDMHEPLEFEAGMGRLIKGFDSQALKMKVGEKRTIIIPPHLAYGNQGAAGVIPPNAVLIFELELLGIK